MYITLFAKILWIFVNFVKNFEKLEIFSKIVSFCGFWAFFPSWYNFLSLKIKILSLRHNILQNPARWKSKTHQTLSFCENYFSGDRWSQFGTQNTDFKEFTPNWLHRSPNSNISQEWVLLCIFCLWLRGFVDISHTTRSGVLEIEFSPTSNFNIFQPKEITKELY